VKGALKQLVYDLESEQTEARLSQVKSVLLNREMFAGRQVVYWDANDYRWKSPTEDEIGAEAYQDLQLITNFYQGYVLIVMAELSQSPPRTAFVPERPKEQADIQLAHASTDLVNYINRHNKTDERLAYQLWLLCNDGSYATYSRFVRDEKFGIEEYEIRDGDREIEAAPAQAVCPSCGYAVPVESPEQAPPICPTCSAPMGPDSFQPPQMTTAANMVKQTRPAGKLIEDIVGMLELVIPSYEKDEEELGFLTWCREVHKSKLMAIFENVAQSIEAGGSVTDSSTSSYERQARLSLLSGWPQYTDGRQSLVTFRETWVRPYHFAKWKTAQPDLYAKLMKAYPDGSYVAFAGEQYCASRSEALQDHWTITHAYPGDGQYRQAVGSASVPVQRKYNKLDSIRMETMERGLSFYVVDAEEADADALRGQAEAGEVITMSFRGGKTAGNSIWQSEPAPLSEHVPRTLDDLSEKTMQHQFGAFPSMYGGDMGANDTAHGIAMERAAARGRLGLIYRAIKNGRARSDLKNLNLFLDPEKGATQDVQIAVLGPGSEYDSVMIDLQAVRGGKVQVEIEEDESYPVSLNEQREVLNNLVSNQNPIALSWFQGSIANNEELADKLGVATVLTIPGADARRKCYDIISKLIQSAPIMPPPPDPMGPPGPLGAPPMPPPPPEPSIQPDPILDDLHTYVISCREWASSEAGCKAQLENAAGYANVKAFAQACQMILTPPPLPGPPPGVHPGAGGPPVGPPGPIPPNGGGPGPTGPMAISPGPIQ